MNFIKNNKLIFILILILVLGIIALFIFSIQKDKSKVSNLPIKNQDLKTNFYQPYIKNIVGQKPKDLDKQEGFKDKKEEEGKTIYNYNSGYLAKDNNVIVENNLINFKNVVTLLPDKTLPKISDYLKELGNPEEEIEGTKTYGRFSTTLAYPSRGFALIGNKITDEVYEIQSFLPLSKEEYKIKWGVEIMDYSQVIEDHSPEKTPTQFFIVSHSARNNTLNAFDPLIIVFSKSVNRDTLEIEITPKIDAFYDFDVTTQMLTITPIKIWEYDMQYQIKIGQSSEDSDSNKLPEDYQINFKINPRDGI